MRSLFLLLCLFRLAAGAQTTIALAATEGSFSKAYPLDSLVRHLNVLAVNKQLRFVRSTEDETATGHRADQYVEIRLELRPPLLDAPRTVPTPVTDYEQRSVRGVDGVIRTEQVPIIRYENRQEESKTLPGKATCYLRYRGKPLNSDVEKEAFVVTATDERELEAKAIIELLNRLLARFDPVGAKH